MSVIPGTHTTCAHSGKEADVPRVVFCAAMFPFCALGSAAG